MITTSHRTSGRVLCAVALAAALAAGCAAHSAAEPGAADKGKQAVEVTTVRPERKTLRRTTDQPGQVEAFEETPLYAKVSGYVLEVMVDIGDRVQHGQVLAELSVPELQEELRQKDALVAQAQAEQAQAQAAVVAADAGLATAGARIEEVQATSKRSEAEFDRWKSELDRIERLVAENAVQRKVADETRAQFRAADAAREEAAAKIASAQAGLREADAKLGKARADVDAAAARLEVAQADRQRTAVMLDYTHVRAPFDGTVTRRGVHTGHFIPASGSREPLFIVMRTDPVRILVDVPEKDAVAIHPGSPALVRVQTAEPSEFPATVTRSAWALDPQARTLRAQVEIPNPDGALRPGMYAYASITVAERADVWAIPSSAVLRQGDKTFCVAVVDGRASRLAVTLGASDGTLVEVTSGITGTEEIVESGGAALAEGQAVGVKSSGS